MDLRDLGRCDTEEEKDEVKKLWRDMGDTERKARQESEKQRQATGVKRNEISIEEEIRRRL